jgi:hypothetical protein
MAQNISEHSLQDTLLLSPTNILCAEISKSMTSSQLRFKYLSEQDFRTFDIIACNDMGGCVATALAY